MIKHTLSTQLLSSLSSIIEEHLGLNYPEVSWRELEQKIRYYHEKESDYESLTKTVESLLSSSLSEKQLQTLAQYLTIGETYFFRDKKFYEALEKKILPSLMTEKQTTRQLRIWSAGCCTGEEPYSVRILLDKIIPKQEEWNISILASDINPEFLWKMEKGVYNNWSFRDVSDNVKQKYFNSTIDGKHEVKNRFRRNITISNINLAEDSYPSFWSNTYSMDLIICRNVLIYFSEEEAQKTVHRFYRSLANGGRVVVSPTETSQKLFSDFETINYPGVVVYKKTNQVPTLVPVQQENEKGPVTAKKADGPTEPAAPTAPAGPNVPSEKSALEKARKQYHNGCYKKAKHILNHHLTSHRKDSDACGLLARIYANLGEYDQAITWCEEAIGLDKSNPAFHYLKGTVLEGKNELQAALDSHKRAIYLDKDFVLAHVMAGNMAVRLGRRTEAQKSFQNALKLLQKYKSGEVILEGDGITAQRLAAFIKKQTLVEL